MKGLDRSTEMASAALKKIKEASELIDLCRSETLWMYNDISGLMKRSQETINQLENQLSVVHAEADALQMDDKRCRQKLVALYEEDPSCSEALKQAYDEAFEVRINYFMKQQQEEHLEALQTQQAFFLLETRQGLEKTERWKDRLDTYQSNIENSLVQSIQSLIEEYVQLEIGILEAREDTRLLIAEQLHGELTGHLDKIFVKAEACRRAFEKENIKNRAVLEFQNDVKTLINGLNQTMYQLKPENLDEVGLSGTLRRFAQEYTEETGIHLEVRVGSGEEHVEPLFKRFLYRVIQDVYQGFKQSRGVSKSQLMLEFGNRFMYMTADDDSQRDGIEKTGFSYVQETPEWSAILETVQQLRGQIRYDKKLQGGGVLELILPVGREALLLNVTEGLGALTQTE